MTEARAGWRDWLAWERWRHVTLGVSLGLNLGAVLKNVRVGNWEIAGLSAAVVVALVITAQVAQQLLAWLRIEEAKAHAQLGKALVEQEIATKILAQLHAEDAGIARGTVPH